MAKLGELEAHLTQALDDLVARIRALESVQTKQEQAKQMTDAVAATVTAARTVGTVCTPVLREIRNLSHTPQNASKVIERTPNCVNAVKELVGRANEAKRVAQALLNAAELETAADQVVAEVEKTLESMLALQKLLEVVGAYQNSVSGPEWAEEATFLDRSLGALVGSRIDLNKTPRKPGDYVSYQGLIRDSQRDEVVVEGPLRSTKVVVNGAQLRMSGSLVFLQPGRLAENEDEFRAAPRVHWGFSLSLLSRPRQGDSVRILRVLERGEPWSWSARRDDDPRRSGARSGVG